MNLSYGKIGIGVGLLSLGYSIYISCKLKKVTDVLDVTIDNMADKVVVEVEEAIVEAAIDVAVDREVNRVVRETGRRLNDEIRQQVRDSVRESYTDIKEKVTDEIASQAKHINMSALESEVVDKAKRIVADKFDSKLDGLADEFNGRLREVTKIYSAISKKMEGNI